MLIWPAYNAVAQVKIGYNAATVVEPAAVLELSNNTAATASNWKGMLPPSVDFGNTAVFPDNAVWGISGTATDGALVYNTAARVTNGFTGPGLYVWRAGAWASLILWQGTPGGCNDPGLRPGETGCVTFTYNGQQVTHTTVRAKDGKVWLQQNLGSLKVADSLKDADAFGHAFQWGRWDDGHQLPGSTAAATGTLTANNPSGLGAGSATFFTGSPPSDWWGGGSASNTWSDNPPSATNGKDPCAALGPGWRLPDIATCANLLITEQIADVNTGFASNLKLPTSGNRGLSTGNAGGATLAQYWTSTAADAQKAYLMVPAYLSESNHVNYRGYGFRIRCVKD